MAIEILSTLFSGPAESGNSLLSVVGNNNRYATMDATLLKSSGLYQNINFAELVSSAVATANLFFFTNDDYTGEFIQVTASGDGGDIKIGIGGPLKSCLLVASAKQGVNEQRFSFRGLFQQKWDDFIDATLAGTQASRVGEPTLTWEMFPENVDGLPSNFYFLKIHQDLHIDVPNWFDYDASLTYWIWMFGNFGNHLRVWVVKSETWVESGIIHDEIFDRLDPSVQNGASTLMDEINGDLALLDGALGKVTDVYYLPANQVQPPESSRGGNTDDDVTIVVVSEAG